jgi:hypothetical protein
MDGGSEPEVAAAAEESRRARLPLLRELVESGEGRRDGGLQGLPESAAPGRKEGSSQVKWFVEIVENGGAVVKRIECGASERSAEKVQRGAEINLNHERFFTRLVIEPEEVEAGAQSG